MSTDASSSSFLSAEDEAKLFDKITTKGQEGGLFQACMKAIRTAHFRSNRTRAVLVIAGLLTDKKIYRDVLSIFYAVTKEVEIKMQAFAADNDTISKKLLALKYHFTPLYEKDLACLYDNSSDWKDEVEAVVNRSVAAVAYRDKIRGMTSGVELAGATFCLWGALIIGGGAVAMPRIRSAFGPDAVHLFQDVTGPGREQRRRNFIQTWDSLVADEGPAFHMIVQSSQECMQGNNNVLSTLPRNPWWLPLVGSVVVGALSVVVVVVQRRWRWAKK